jgi:hypothetical protein
MCIILIGNRQAIESHDLQRLWISNPHGAGVAYTLKRKVVAIKGLMSLKSLDFALSKIDKDQQIAVHLRLATHGSINRQNTHPHRSGNTVLMHNGILSNFGESGTGKSSRSDSADLADTIKDLPLANKLKVLASLNGKFCLVTSQGIEIVNPESWIEHEGVLASNNQIKPVFEVRQSRKDWIWHNELMDWKLPNND